MHGKVTKYAMILATLMACRPAVLIETNPPNVDTFIGDKFIGKTPLNLSQDNLNLAMFDSGMKVTLKPLRQDDIILVLPPNIGDLKLKIDLQQVQNLSRTLQTQDNAIQSTAKADRLISRQRLDRDSGMLLDEQAKIFIGKPADQDKLKRLQTDHPNSGGAVFLEAMTEFLGNKQDEANSVLERAIDLNSVDVDYRAVFSELRVQSGKAKG